MKQPLEYHISNGYFVKIQRLKQDYGCFVEYPNSLLKSNPFDSHISCYFIKEDKIDIMDNYESKDSKRGIVCPNYSHRTVVLFDILHNLKKHDIHTSLMLYFDNKGDLLSNQSIAGLLDVKLDSDNLTKEKNLVELSQLVILGRDCSQLAEEQNIVDGYKIVKRIFDSGENNV